MERYANLRRNSGVLGFEIGVDCIIVWFKRNSRPYRYSYAKAGTRHIENMKVLAERGKGLNSYIKKHVNKLYN